MSVGEWVAVVGVCLTVAGTGVSGWVTLRSRLDLLIHIQGEIRKRQEVHNEQIQRLWEVHHHQEGRMYMQDRVLVSVIHHLGLKLDYPPKENPHDVQDGTSDFKAE